jgi:hypothetical protein
MTIELDSEVINRYKAWRADWCLFAREVLRLKLDSAQEEILRAIQSNRRVSVRSGTARGKDFVAAVASICFLYLTPGYDENQLFHPTKVILTAPTGRQIRNIMIPEISKMFTRAKILPGKLMAGGIRFDEPEFAEWFLDGFKAHDENIEAWSGIHAPNVMVVVTEASGLSQTVFNSIDGILQGNSRLVLIFNPNRTVGEAYNSTKSPLYKKFRLNSLDSPNVIAKKIIIPGQVDYDWIHEKLTKPGWVLPIKAEDAKPEFYDFEFEGNWYRPQDLFRVKVLGEFPEESDDTLIPLSWLEAANQRWIDAQENKNFAHDPKLRLGADIAGMGRDHTIFSHRYENYVKSINLVHAVKDATVHMQIAGRIKTELAQGGEAFIDTIGEGAGVYSRLVEDNVRGVYSVKFSEGAGGLTDVTGQRKFMNMRSYLYWALRDALNPIFKYNLMLPPCDELTEELTSIIYKINSTGAIQIEPKEDIVKKIGRSTDFGDSLVNTFYPHTRHTDSTTKPISKDDLGLL